MRRKKRSRSFVVSRRRRNAVAYDYLITNDAEWASTFALGAGTLSGKTIAVAPGNYTTKTISGFNPASTVRLIGLQSNNKPIIDRLRVTDVSNLIVQFLSMVTSTTDGGGSTNSTAAILFSGTASENISFIGCDVAVRYISSITDSMFWSPLPNTLYSVIFCSSGTVNNLRFESCDFDCGLVSFASGGRANVNTSIRFNSWCTNLTFKNNTVRNAYTGLYLSINGFTIEGNLFDGRHADGIVLQNSSTHCENGVIRNNHFMNHFGDPGNFHMDHIQIQPSNNSNYVRNIEIYGNTASAGSLLMPQPDKSAADPLTVYTSSFTADDTMIGKETRIAPAGNMTVTLPSATSSVGKQYCFRYTGTSGVVSFAFNGSDTWEGGTPVLDAAGKWATFVSDGTTVWKKLRPGYRAWYLLRKTSTTLSNIENGLVVNIDASDGNVDITLPDNGNQTYAIRRIDFSSNTVRLLTTGGNTISLNDATVSEVNFVPSYSIDITGNGAGVWTATEDPVTNQGFFANAHPNGLYENIRFYGNVFFGSSVGFRIEQDVPGLLVYNNTFLRPFYDDRNGDGFIGQYELSGSRNMDVDVRGSTAFAWNNITVGSMLLSSGTVPARDLGSVSLGITTTNTIPASITDRFVATTKAALQPQTRSEVLAAALAKSGESLDGTLIGALGTTLSNGFYNFSTGQVNTSALPAPTISVSDPLNGGTISESANITLTMSQFCKAGTGNVTIRNVTDNINHEVFNVGTGTGSEGGTITFDGRVITINPANNMTAGKSFSLRVDSGSIIGHYDIAMAAIADDTTLNWVTDGSAGFFTEITASGARLNRASTLVGVSGAKQKFVCAWNGYRTGGATLGYLIELDGVRDFRVTLLGNGEVRINAGTSSFRIPSGGATAASETHLLTVDTAAATLANGVKYYRNGSAIDTSAFTNVTWNSGTDVNFGTVQNVLFNGTGAANALHGVFGFVYFDIPGTLIDIADSSVRAKFTPSQIGSDGSGPTGTAPLIYFTGEASVWNAGTNLGTGGSFTATGTFT
jgi:hypothetical protein